MAMAVSILFLKSKNVGNRVSLSLFPQSNETRRCKPYCNTALKFSSVSSHRAWINRNWREAEEEVRLTSKAPDRNISFVLVMFATIISYIICTGMWGIDIF